MKREIANRPIQKYKQKDASGEFLFTREVGPMPGKKEYAVKGQLEANSNVLEKTVSISSIEKNFLLPKISQYSVWINKEKHFSEIQLDTTSNQLIIKLISPDLKNNGVKFFPLPENSPNLCFFTQIVECARVGGFFEKAEDDKKAIDLNIIWDGFPFYHQLFEGFPAKLLSSATLEYGGKHRNGTKRFILKVEGDPIIYEVDPKEGFLRRFWFSKGVTIEKMGDTF